MEGGRKSVGSTMKVATKRTNPHWEVSENGVDSSAGAATSVCMVNLMMNSA